MLLQVGVKILLKNTEGKYLLARRNPKKYPEVGPKWDIIGGRINPGSPLLDNLKREIKEEVGLDYQGQPKLMAAQDIMVRGQANTAEESLAIEKHVVRLTYAGEIEGQPQIDEESLEAKWFSAEELKNVDKGELDKYFNELLEQGTITL